MDGNLNLLEEMSLTQFSCVLLKYKFTNIKLSIKKCKRAQYLRAVHYKILPNLCEIVVTDLYSKAGKTSFLYSSINPLRLEGFHKPC